MTIDNHESQWYERSGKGKGTIYGIQEEACVSTIVLGLSMIIEHYHVHRLPFAGVSVLGGRV